MKGGSTGEERDEEWGPAGYKEVWCTVLTWTGQKGGTKHRQTGGGLSILPPVDTQKTSHNEGP